MRRTFNKKSISGAFGLALLLLSIVGVASYVSLYRLKENKGWVEHTHQVLDTLEEISDGLKDGERGRRGYILTENTIYLQDYLQGSQKTEQAIKRLRQLTLDNAKQQQRLNDLEPSIEQKWQQLRQSIEHFEQNPSDRKTQSDLTEQGKRIQDKILAILVAMSNEERTLLVQRSQATDASTFYTSSIVGIGYCLSFSLLIAVYWLLKKEIYHRQLAEEVLSQTNEQLESRVQERTLELTQSNASLKDEIFERRQAEEKIREQAALLDIVTDAILVCDLEYRILFWNKSSERLYGWTVEEAIKKYANIFLSKGNSPRLAEALKLVVETGEWQGELQQLTKDGKEIDVASRYSLVQDELGQSKAILIVNTDITQKKRVEEQFLRAQRLESLGTLASGIAHDLNNVSTPILAAVQLLPLKFPNLDERSQQLLKLLEVSALRGADLVKQILSFGRGVEGDRTNVQVRHLLSDLTQVARQTFPKSIETQTALSPDLWTVFADSTQLHQILMNLIVNARDAMPDGGTLSISAENLWIDENYARMHPEAQVGSYIVITIADTGMGIAPEIIDRIFDPFFTTKEVGKGTGLGLSTTIGIIKSHGGFVTVYSEVGNGSRFKVYLPSGEGAEPRSTESTELLDGKGELILVVDDEVSICEIAKTILESHNYQVLTANNGIETLALYAQYKDEIDVVLMDMMMPLMDGQTTILTLQRIKPQVRIVAMSGLMVDGAIAKAKKLGIETFLPKPFTANILLSTLQKIINSA